MRSIQNILRGLQEKVVGYKQQMQRGREGFQRDRVTRMQRKMKKQQSYEPGTLRYGFSRKQSVGSFCRDAYYRRQRLRMKQREEDDL